LPLLARAGVEGGDATTGPATAGGGSPGGGAAGWEGGASGGGELEEVEGVLPLPSPWAGMERGGGTTVACGGGRRRAWRRRCGLGEEASGGGRVRSGRGLREEPIYKRGKVVEEGGPRWWPAGELDGASLMA